jgi:DNA-binding transcriptional MerR regulator
MATDNQKRERAGLLTSKEVAEMAGVSAPLFSYYLRNNKITRPAQTVGGQRKYYTETTASQVVRFFKHKNRS